MNYIIENAEVKYPRIDKTYKFDTTQRKVLPMISGPKNCLSRSRKLMTVGTKVK